MTSSTDIVKALRDEAAARRTPTEDFLPLSDKVTADLLESGAKEIEHQRELVGGLIADMICPPFTSDTTRALIDMLIQRDQAGRAKYGTTLDRTDLTREQWLQHLIEEMLDGAGYALRAKQTAAAAATVVEHEWVLVPRILTQAMEDAGYPADTAADAWSAMLAAAPHFPSRDQTAEEMSRAIYSAPADAFTTDAALKAFSNITTHSTTDASYLGGRIRDARKAARLTQTQLALSAGLTQQVISVLERDRYARTTRLGEIARALGVDVNWLAFGVKENSAPTWDRAPPWAKFLAMDADGTWVWYELRPFTDHFSVDPDSYWDVEEGRREKVKYQRHMAGWETTLQERPEAST
jgi:transcriptional regulator with XRE-family HTH domain